jgi:hypothetical protein
MGEGIRVDESYWGAKIENILLRVQEMVCFDGGQPRCLDGGDLVFWFRGSGSFVFCTLGPRDVNDQPGLGAKTSRSETESYLAEVALKA